MYSVIGETEVKLKYCNSTIGVLLQFNFASQRRFTKLITQSIYSLPLHNISMGISKALVVGYLFWQRKRHKLQKVECQELKRNVLDKMQRLIHMVKRHFTSSPFQFEQNFMERVEKRLKYREITRRTKCHNSGKQLQIKYHLMVRAHGIYWRQNMKDMFANTKKR